MAYQVQAGAWNLLSSRKPLEDFTSCRWSAVQSFANYFGTDFATTMKPMLSLGDPMQQNKRPTKTINRTRYSWGRQGVFFCAARESLKVQHLQVTTLEASLQARECHIAHALPLPYPSQGSSHASLHRLSPLFRVESFKLLGRNLLFQERRSCKLHNLQNSSTLLRDIVIVFFLTMTLSKVDITWAHSNSSVSIREGIVAEAERLV